MSIFHNQLRNLIPQCETVPKQDKILLFFPTKMGQEGLQQTPELLK